MNPYSVHNIHRSFKRFDKEIRDLWESYALIEHYLPLLRRDLYSGAAPSFSLMDLAGVAKVRSVKDTAGAIQHILLKAYPRRTLLEGVALFEEFMSGLVEIVYLDFPAKLTSSNPSTEKEDFKILDMVINSSTREEVIEKVTEEKVRGIFYGNPADLFTKPKIKLDFGDFFTSNCSADLLIFSEVVARRNIAAHNAGRVDRKYMRENPTNPYDLQLGQVAPLPSTYLFESVNLLRRLAAVSAALVVKRIYKHSAQGTLRSRLTSLPFSNMLI